MFVPVEQLVDSNIGQYKLKKLIGMSVLSAVYEAVPSGQPGSSAMLTVFRLPDECVGEAWELFMERFEYESSRLKALQHPHIVPYYEFGEEFGYPYLITPFTANRTLADVLKQGACTPAQMMQLLKQIASGLDYVHSNGIVHGSLKPSNILLRDEPAGQRVLIANVGLTQILEMRGIGQVSYSHPHLFSVAGTLLTNPAYLAPEVVQGTPSDARADMYALGILVYEMLCGRPPFTGSDPLDVALQHVEQRIPPLQSIKPELPQAFDAALRRVFERDPDRRIQKAEKLVSSIERTTTILQDTSQKNLAPVAQAASSKAAQIMQGDQPWQGMPGITRNKMPSIAPEFAVSSMVATKRDTNSQFRPARSGALPSSASAPLTTPVNQAAPTPHGGQLFKPPMAPGGTPPAASPLATQIAPSVQPSGQSYKMQTAAKASEALATQISTGMQAMKESEALVRQLASGTQSPVIPNGYVAQSQAQYATMQASPSQIQGGWAGERAIGTPANAGTQAGAMYNNAPGYAQPMGGGGYEQAIYNNDPGYPQPIMGGGGYEQAAWFQQYQQMSPNKKRRALVIVGATAAAAVLTAGGFSLLRMMQSKSEPDATPVDKNNGTQAAPASTGGQKQSGQVASTPVNKTAGVLIANQKNLATSATLDFTNPVDKHPSVLVHLPDGHFVAYNKACTHQGVSVVYDPKTNTLVCPLHHSVFDPTNNGAVVHGPAFVRLPQVPIHVNADGSITAG